MKQFVLLLFVMASGAALAQEKSNENIPQWKGKFEQLDQILPTPNEYRTGSGSPGPKYWQQQADYDITAELNDEKQTISGIETITYINNSPDVLKYLWLQLDQNLFEKESSTAKTSTGGVRDSAATKQLLGPLNIFDFEEIGR